MLQWGRGLSTAEISPRATAVRTWSRFNGAAVSQPRKCVSRKHPRPRRGASMGPRSLNRGNTSLASMLPVPENASMGPRSLNRGNMVKLKRLRTAHGASMGPRSLNRGNDREAAGGGARCAASMGPRSLNRGNTCYHDNRVYRGDASMGPRSLNRGNLTLLRCSSSSIARFNGAAVSQPRKSSTKTQARCASRCFNGAAVSQPRK